MKALSVKQPWANAIATGEKTIETRTWMTDYRGPLLIVSSKTPPIEPAGKALCVVDLVDCRPFEACGDELAALCNWYPDACSWVLDNLRPLKYPFPVRGQLGLYDVDDGLIDKAFE